MQFSSFAMTSCFWNRDDLEFGFTTMNRIELTVAVLLASMVPACRPGNDTAPVRISAIELHTAFMADAKAAAKRWSSKTLLITGDVAMAKARTSGRTMNREVQVPAQVYLRTELDHSISDIKYVVVDGDFDVPQTGGGLVLDARIAIGKPLTVECRSARFRWTSPGLYLSDCRIAGS
jgi:hypothetical protein